MSVVVMNDISKFCVAGVNYKKTDAVVRGRYAVNDGQYRQILSRAASYGVKELFVLSTCNRTEIYGFTEDVSTLIHLMCACTSGDEATFQSLAYIQNGTDAVQHLYYVAAGLDSQILGDYEIVGQIRQSVKFSRQHNLIGAHLDRLVNSVLQCSKVIRNTTSISSGTVSVSFAGVQYIKQQFPDFSKKKILLLGVGKIGRSTCKNLVDYLGTRNITLINRTPQKAAALAEELGLHAAGEDEMERYIQLSDVVIVATNASQPVLLRSHLLNSVCKLIIDLSIPYNVDTVVKELPGIQLINVDELSGFKDETLKKRGAEIPMAKSIINVHLKEFSEWCKMRKHLFVLKAVKSKLHEITSPSSPVPVPASVMPVTDPHEKIQKVIDMMALKMRRQNRQGCQYIEAINDFMGMVAI